MDLNPQTALLMQLLQQGQTAPTLADGTPAPPPNPPPADIPDFGMAQPPSEETYAVPSTSKASLIDPAMDARGPASPSLFSPSPTEAAQTQDAPSLVAPPAAAKPAPVADPVYGKTYADQGFSKRQKTLLMLSALQDIGSTLRGEQGGEFDREYAGYGTANQAAYAQQMAMADQQRRKQIADAHPEWSDAERYGFTYSAPDKSQEVALGSLKPYDATAGNPHVNPINRGQSFTPPVYSTAGGVASANGPAGVRSQALVPSYQDITARGAATATAAEARAKVAQGDWFQTDVTRDGHPVYLDRHTNQKVIGTEFVVGKNSSVYNQKKADLAKFMPEEEADRWAAGQRPMSDAEIEDHAERSATSRVMAGGDPADHDKFKAEAVAGLRAANAGLGGGGIGGTSPPPAAAAPPSTPGVAAPGQKNFIMPPPSFVALIRAKPPGVATTAAGGHVYTTNQAGQITQIR